MYHYLKCQYFDFRRLSAYYGSLPLEVREASGRPVSAFRQCTDSVRRKESES